VRDRLAQRGGQRLRAAGRFSTHGQDRQEERVATGADVQLPRQLVIGREAQLDELPHLRVTQARQRDLAATGQANGVQGRGASRIERRLGIANAGQQ
jgi:hypothetical protein